MSLSILSIDCDGHALRHASVKLDGHEIPGLMRLDLSLRTDEVNKVELTIAVDRVEVSADALAALEAHVNAEVTP